MKVLIVVDGFFPGEKYGGPSVSIDNFCRFMDELNCYIVTRNHDLGEKVPYSGIEKGWNKRGKTNVMYLSDEEMSYSTLKKIIEELHPEIIYLQSLFELKTLQCLKIAKNKGIKVILAPRGQLCKGALDKKYKKLPFIYVLRMMGLLDAVVFQSTSDEETEMIKEYLKGTDDRIYLLSNIPSIPHELSEKKEKKSGEASFIFLSRLVGKKNLLGAITFMNGIKGNVIFDIYGPKQNTEYWIKCEKAISELPSNIVVSYKGEVSHNNVHKTFNKYDSFLFPTFSENYGHVIAEAFISGCIPIISDQTPWTDMNEAMAGWALPLDNPGRFTEAIQSIVDMDNESFCQYQKNIKQYLEEKLQLKKLKGDYLKVFK